MKLLSILLTCSLCIVAHAEEAAPQDALKYHDALIKHPHNPTLFNRFYDAWIDSQSVDTLQTFLNDRAQSQGGIHHAILARFQLRRGLENNAIESLSKAIDTLPEDSAILIERANLLLQNQKFADARKDFDRVTTLPNETLAIEAHKQIGKSYLREGNPEAAIQAWEKILSKQPKNEELLEDLVELSSAADQTDQALEYSQRLITSSTDPYQKNLRLMRRGELLAKSGQTDQAIELWTKTLAETGEDSWLEREILALIQLTFRRIDRIDLLSNKLTELATAHPRRLLIHRELAKLEAANGNTESAIGRFREVLRRSPGQIEIREEFIQLLIHSESFDDASAEIEKMIEADPKNPNLHLRLADLLFQKSPDSPVIPQLEKALSLMDPTESSGLRIANLMIQYNQPKQGEALLQQLAAKPDASSAPLEALANEYIRTKRKDQAIEILTKIAASPEQETVLRATSAMAPLGNPEKPYSILLSRLPDFSSNNYFLTAFIQSSLAAKKSAEAIPPALKLVRTSKLPSEISESTKLATTLFAAAEKIPEIINQLETSSPLSTPETCLLAALYETQNLHEKSDTLFKDSTDPALLRFHASILSVRGDFPKAISTLNLLAQSPAGGNASYFKELSDLQLRAGDIQACLKTLDQWKGAAPTDKAPWTISTRLHRESGNHQAAIESSRRALTRFPQDEDLTAILADLYQQSGQRLEAERIYWTLYDQAPDTTSQSRWAARLSALAANHGQTEPLKEKLLQRARSNQQAIGPILALVELSRASRNHQELLEYLYQALRIKPKDTDIRIQIANAEKQVGNIEKQITILNEGIPHDTQGRIRTTLAQALIDQGQILKGMHMLRALSGERASDPRLIETAANSIAGQGMIAEAIQYLEESLPPNSDWRARYLLASLLQQDGREFEATSILLSVVDAKDEIPNLSPNPNFESIQRYKSDTRYYLSSLISHISQELYYIKNPARSGSGQQRPLPASTDEVRFRSKILLALISNIGNPTLNEKINATKIDELDLFTDIVASHTENGPDYLTLINKHPDNKDLIQMVVQQGRLRDPNTGDIYPPEQTNQIYQKLLKSPVVDNPLRILIISSSLQSNPKDKDTWDTFFNLITKQNPDPNNPDSSNSTYQLQNILTQHRANIPAEYLPKIRDMLISKIRSPYEKLSIYALLGEADPWIDAVNEFVRQHQEQIAQQLEAQQRADTTRIIDISQSGFYPQVPQIQNIQLSSVNIHYFQYISSDKFDISGNNNSVRFAAKDLVKKLDRFESPVIRAWIAILAGDEKAIKKSLSVKPSEIEANDFAILKIGLDIENKRFPEACHGLLQLSKAPSIHPHYSHWAQTSFLAVLSSIPPDKNKEFLTPAREIITSYINNKTKSNAQPWSSHYGNDSALLPMCRKLGFDDLVTQLIPKNTTTVPTPRKPITPTKATIGKPLTIVSGNTGTAQSKPSITPLERLNQFSNEKKHTAAAHEFFIHVQSQKKQGFELNYIIAQLKLNDDVKKAIINLADPGNNSSLSKRLQFAEICLALGHKDKSLTTLRSLAAERPFDANINLLLAFNLPPEEIDTAAKVLNQFSNSSNFYTQLNSQIQRIGQNRNNETYFNYFTLITKLIETSDNRKFDQRAFSELNNHIYYFLSGSYLNNIPSLFNTGNSATADSTKHREISRKLCFAMLNHPMLAESGFRYLRSIKWLEKPDEIDQLARKILIQESQQSSRARSNSSNLPEFSTAKWLCERVRSSNSPKSIITPDFLSSVREKDASLADLFESLYSIKTTKDIAKIWESGIMDEDGYYTSRTLVQQELLEKIATIPDATAFFISRIKNLSQNEILNSRSRRTGESNHLPFIRASISSCKNQKQSAVLELCRTIIKSIYGENFKFTDLNTSSREYQIFSNANSIIDNLLSNQDIDPATAVHIFQAFDEQRIPIQNYYWFQNAIQKNQVSDPVQAIKLIDSMGFLNDTQTWKPIAHSTMVHEYDRVTGESSYQINRVILNEIFIQNFDYRLRTKEFVALLENRQPRTFGNLVTAALFSNGSERERLMTLAFEHAAPKLAKASPSQLDDFNFLTAYLPPEATEFLPQKLQAKVKQRNDEKIAALNKSIEMLFEQFKADPTNEPLNSLNESVLLLCTYDVKKAAEVFLRGYEIHKDNFAHFSGHYSTPNIHQSYLGNILRNLSSNSGNKKSRPETAFQFYRSIIDSPVGPEFGHGRNDHYGSYLYLLGSNINNLRDSDTPQNTHGSFRPWLAVKKISKEYQNDAIAAITCYTLSNQSFINPSQLKEQFDKTKDLSDQDREIISACSYVSHIRYLKTDEDRKLAGELFVKLLNNPDFDANTRTQIALSALNTYGILTIPIVAETYAEILTDLSKRDSSIVSNNLINCLSNTTHLFNLTEEVIPHLKKISEAFWDNANTPKKSGHMAITDQQAINLFLFAIRAGDHKNAGHLLPQIRPLATGNTHAITNLLLAGQFELAEQILPDESQSFSTNPRVTHSLDLLEKLSIFSTKSKQSLAILRLECHLMKMMPLNQYGDDLKAKLIERKQQLITSYLGNPPKSLLIRCEILNTILSVGHPLDSNIQKEIRTTAASLDPQQTILNWFSKYRENTTNGLPEEAPYRILCTAAGMNLLDGDPKLFIQTSQSLTKLSSETSESDSYKLRPFYPPLITPAYTATTSAIIEKKTDFFSEILPELEKLSIEISKPSSPSTEDLLNCLALCDFIAHWESQPEKFTQLLKNLQLKSNTSLPKSFASPRKSFLFFDRYRSINQTLNLSRMGDKPIEFVHAILSRESLADIYVVSNSWLTLVDTGDVYQEVMTMGKTPPESVSPSGKAYLRYHSVTRDIHVPEERIAAYQTLLQDIPNSPTWHEISINSKIQLIQNMLRLPTPSAPDMRAVFDSIDPKNIPASGKVSYERISKELNKAETKPE